MNIRVLGCHGAELAHRDTCGFLINDTVLLDAGTICSALTLTEQRNIRAILISHIHADHIKGLPFLSENVIGEPGPPIVIYGLEPVLEGLHRYLFNDHLWPDFTRIPASNPLFRLQPMAEGETVQIEGLAVQAFAVNHTIPCAGFVIRRSRTAFLYSGDTYQTERIWHVAAQTPDLKAAMIETSFPNALDDLARRSKHLTPALLAQEFAKLGRPELPLYIYHMKPRYLDTIRRELDALGIKNLEVLADGQVFEIA
ncbi:MAG: 3',5'-cyclic-nucleotide phosphodiesterase [Nitrospirota bacterium]